MEIMGINGKFVLVLKPPSACLLAQRRTNKRLMLTKRHYLENMSVLVFVECDKWKRKINLR